MALDPQSVWLITGASSGFGRALTAAALSRGFRVVAALRPTSAPLADLAAQFPETLRVLFLDVTQPAQVKSSTGQALSFFGRLDVLVNNAGYGLVGALEECSEEQIWRNFNTNFFGAVRLIRAVLPHFRGQRAGHIVNLSAAAAIQNYPGFSIYGAAKSALETLSESLAAELRPLGIKVTVIEPGPFRTDFIRRSLDDAETRLPEYESSRGKFRAFLEKAEGHQPGDPTKAALAILAAIEAERPPFRLVLGKYATEKVRKKCADLLKELDTWSSVGVPTDFAS